MKYKYINENEIEPLTKRYVEHEGRIYANPTAEQLKMAGYKDLTETCYPEYNPQTQYVVEKYIDEDNAIIHVYEVYDIEKE